MKLFTKILLLIFSFPANAQVFPGDLWLTSQQEVDQFPITYPNVKRISGALVIGKADTVNLSDIDDLTPLAQLEYAQFIYVSNNGPLTSLDGLQGIDTVFGFRAYHNPNLASLHGLDSLRDADHVYILDDDALPNLGGLEALRYADEFGVRGCASLTSLDGLSALENTFFSVFIGENPRLQSLNGLHALEGGIVRIFRNDSLLHFGCFPAWQEGYFEVYENARLVDFAEMACVPVDAYVGLYAYNNPLLTSFSGMEKITRGDLRLAGNTILETVDHFDSLHTVIGLYISGQAIKEIHFPNAHRVVKSEIYNCPRLKIINNSLPEADSLILGLEIFENDSLTTIHEDIGPRYMQSFFVHDNPRLEYITGFEGLQRTAPYNYLNTINCECGLTFKSPAFTKISGFNKLDKSSLDIWVTDGVGGHFEEVSGFNGMEETAGMVFIRRLGVQPLVPGDFPARLLGFSNLRKISNELSFRDIRDTLDAFPLLDTIGSAAASFGVNEVMLRVADSCHVTPSSLANLSFVQNSYMENAGYSGPLLVLPQFERAPNTLLVTWGNPDISSFAGVYPALNTLGLLDVHDCPGVRSLAGLEHIQHFSRVPTFNPGPFLNIIGNDSLTDCSAVCEILDNATFYPANYPKATVENPLFPCTDLATVLAWCDTVTVAAEPPTLTPVGAAGPGVYPNPVAGPTLFVRAESCPDGRYAAAIADANGRVIDRAELTFQAGLAAAPLGNLGPGWYRLTWYTREGKLYGVAFVRQ